MDIKDFAKRFGISLNQNDVGVIKYFLFNEYGYHLPKIERTTQVVCKSLLISELNYHKHRIDRLITENKLGKYDNLNLPIIVLNTHEFWLIDGYHRLASSILNNDKTIDAFVLSE